MRLYVNIDHVATVRQARRTDEPDPVEAAMLADLGGADGITIHLREDRRHIQDNDVRRLMECPRTGINLEVAANRQMIRIACELRPMQVTIVPEKREEVTTEGGLNLTDARARRGIAWAVKELREAGIRTALFVDPIRETLVRSVALGVEAVELHTGEYADAHGDEPRAFELARLHRAARFGVELGLSVHAGHGLTYRNVVPVAALPEIEELNIGHSIVSRSILVGMEHAVREMRDLVLTAPDRVAEPGHWVPPRGY